ncbi:MAG: hypothetical protein HC872_00055 [Gammaproteobacteria bacterium]|nr:hypothetical protein [Gammaproteobacteria bacterium]
MQTSSSRALLWGIAFSAAFTALIYFLGEINLKGWVLAPDRPGMWYEWQLLQPSFLSRATAWGGYLLHQVAFWAVIYAAQKQRLNYTTNLKRLNVIALAVNAGFILLHLAQTHVFYDGTAQDVPEWTAQWSVIVLLILILIMENPRRGLFFGHKAPGLGEATRLARKYHGYYFAWASIYTFWYHPMEFTSGHLLGFLYMFFLLLQGSLFFTRAHTNRYWTIVIEVMVVFHGVMIAVMNANDHWHMFGFGLAGIFVVTQAHGLGLAGWLRALLVALYVAILVGYYSLAGWDNFPAVLRILVGEYVAVPILALLILLIAWPFKRRIA